MLAANFSFYSVSHAQNSPQNTEQASGDKNALDPDFQKMLDESKQTEVAPSSSLKDDVKVEAVANSGGDNEKKAPRFPLAVYELVAVISIGAAFLLLNFLASVFLPKYRYLFIAMPFDLGVKEEKTDAQHAVKGQRFFIETVLLIIVIAFYYWIGLGDKLTQDENIQMQAVNGLSLCVVGYLFYVITRLIIGFSSRCPSCKNMFAKKVLSSWDEPKSTYQKLQSDTSNPGHKIYVSYEKGLTISENICRVCDHQWTTRSSYTKRLG